MSGSNNRSVQLNFIQRLKDSLPSSVSFVDEIADLLDVSADSAYRRIRGETALSLDEVAILCAHFRIAPDLQPSGSSGNTVTFNYHHLSDNALNFEQYLTNIANDMKRIKSASHSEIIFAAEDIPIFHHFQYPLLTAFKLFYWNRSILNTPELDAARFDPALINDNLKAQARSIYDLYIETPSIEIWSEDTLNSTVKQVEYYWESGLFASKADALNVLGDIEKMISGIERQAGHSSKFSGEVPPAGSTQNYTLYCSELMIGNNCILVRIGSNSVTYISYNTFNSMTTASQSFNEETDRWLRNLIRKSIPISGVSEKQRFRFFKMMNDKIVRMREKIEAE
ncbi:MAG: hypothetical protein ACRC3B_16715 [Bacteroidia bacterium]